MRLRRSRNGEIFGSVCLDGSPMLSKGVELNFSTRRGNNCITPCQAFMIIQFPYSHTKRSNYD